MSDTETKSFPLFRPVTAYGEPVNAVTIRRPTVKELAECGQPYTVGTGGGGAIKADYPACRLLLAKVTSPPLPLMAIDDLDGADFDDMAMTLVGFTKRSRPGAGESGSAPTA